MFLLEGLGSLLINKTSGWNSGRLEGLIQPFIPKQVNTSKNDHHTEPDVASGRWKHCGLGRIPIQVASTPLPGPVGACAPCQPRKLGARSPLPRAQPPPAVTSAVTSPVCTETARAHGGCAHLTRCPLGPAAKASWDRSATRLLQHLSQLRAAHLMAAYTVCLERGQSVCLSQPISSPKRCAATTGPAHKLTGWDGVRGRRLGAVRNC